MTKKLCRNGHDITVDDCECLMIDWMLTALTKLAECRELQYHRSTPIFTSANKMHSWRPCEEFIADMQLFFRRIGMSERDVITIGRQLGSNNGEARAGARLTIARLGELLVNDGLKVAEYFRR